MAKGWSYWPRWVAIQDSRLLDSGQIFESENRNVQLTPAWLLLGYLAIFGFDGRVLWLGTDYFLSVASI